MGPYLLPVLMLGLFKLLALTSVAMAQVPPCLGKTAEVLDEEHLNDQFYLEKAREAKLTTWIEIDPDLANTLGVWT